MLKSPTTVRIIWLQKAGETTHTYEEKRESAKDPVADKLRRRVLRASGKSSSERVDTNSANNGATNAVNTNGKPTLAQAASSGRVKVRKTKRSGSKTVDDILQKDDESPNLSAPINIHEPPSVKLVSFADIMAKMQEKQAAAVATVPVETKKQDDVAVEIKDNNNDNNSGINNNNNTTTTDVVVAPPEAQPAPVVVVQEAAVVPPVDIVVELHHVDATTDAPAAVSAPVTPKPAPDATPAVNGAPANTQTDSSASTTDSGAGSQRPRRTAVRSARPDAKEWLVQFVDLDAAEEARDRVLGDDAATTWAMFTYSGNSTSAIELEATGNNCASLRQRFDSRRAQYALLRWTHKSSGSTLTKFVAIHWQGAQVGTLAKARSATHKSSMRSFFRNVHVDIAARALGDVTDDAIASAVLRGAGGQAAVPRVSPRIVMHTMHREPASAEQKEQKLAALQQLNTSDGLTNLRRTVSNSGSSATTAGDAKLAAELGALQKTDGELELVGQAFKSESTGPCWIVCGLKGATIVEVGTGASGIAGITAALRERAQAADAALLFLRARQPSTYGQLQQRTALIEFVSPSVRPVQRARMQPDRQRARNLFGHHNVYLEVFSEADLGTLEETLVAAMSKH
jgi:hypothetical protein